MGEHEKGDADAPWGAGIALDFVRPRMGIKKAPELGGEGLHEIRGEYSTCGYETPVSPPRAGTGRAELTERTGRSSRPWVQCITVQVARASTFSSQAPSPSSGCRRPSRDSRPPRCGRRRGSTDRRLGAATSARRRGWS